MTLYTPPQICRSPSRTAGGCSFCDQHITENGEVDHTVTVVIGRGSIIRFCNSCAREFRTMSALLERDEPRVQPKPPKQPRVGRAKGGRPRKER